MHAQVARAAMVLAVVALLSGGGVASMYGVLGTARKPAGTAADPRPTAIPGVSQSPETRRTPPTTPQGPGTLDADPVSATFPLGARASSAPATALPAPPPVAVSEGEPSGAKGVLTVSPLFLDLAGDSDGSIEVRAEGGPVAWRTAVQGPIRVEPSSGKLQAGQAMTVRVHVSRRPDEQGAGTITFQPGAVHVRVTWRQDAPPDNGPSPTPTGSASETPSTPPETQRPESPHPSPSGTERPESPQPSSPQPSSPQPTPQPPTTPSPVPPSSSTPETTPTPAERASGTSSSNVSPASTG